LRRAMVLDAVEGVRGLCPMDVPIVNLDEPACRVFIIRSFVLRRLALGLVYVAVVLPLFGMASTTAVIPEIEDLWPHSLHHLLSYLRFPERPL
jgi:hypothetical protein